ncbi:MAG: MlaD family protein, partial [Elusimicrobiota bacterium]|nr:MlaD family protein [Elusimicrobiota bacterium]
MNNSVKLGLFTALGLAAIIISIIAVGDISISRQIKVYALFDNVTGVTQKARVRIAGVDIGFLNGAALQGQKARLTLAINRDVKLYKNAKASIGSSGIIGSKYIEIQPGDDSYPLIENGDTIMSAPSNSLNDVIDRLGKSLDPSKMQAIFDNLAVSVDNIREVTSSIASQSQEIKAAINNFYMFSKNLESITEENKNDIRAAIVNLKDVSDKLDAMVANIFEGDGLAGVLLSDEQIGEDFKETIASAKETMKSVQEALGGASKLQIQWEYMG